MKNDIDNDTDLFKILKQMGQNIVTNGKNVKGAKFLIFFEDGRTFEYNSKLDETLW